MAEVPALSRAELAELDRLAVEVYGLPIEVLMENAGRGAAEQALELLAGLPPGEARVVVLCGGGNNGGDGYVLARHLRICGLRVEVVSTAPTERASRNGAGRGAAAIMRGAVERMGLLVLDGRVPGPGVLAQARLGEADLIVDGLLGTGFRPPVRDCEAAWIREVNRAKRDRGSSPGPRVLALDLPSGLEADSGRAGEPTIEADRTVTFAAPKLGFCAPGASRHLGTVVTASIGLPGYLVRRARADA